MAPIIDHHRVSRGLREIVKPATPSAPEAEGQGVILAEGAAAQITDIVAYIKSRAEEVAALIGTDALKDLDRTMKILHVAEDREREGVRGIISGVRELAFLQVKRVCELIVTAEKLQKAEYKEASVAKRAAYLEEMNKALEKEVDTDALTNLYNKRGLNKEGKKIFEYCKEHEIPISCLYIDIDYFKIINDKFGHEVGDAILKAFSEIVAEEFREYDLIFRGKSTRGAKKAVNKGATTSELAVDKAAIVGKDGGDEVVVLMPHTNVQEAAAAAERLRKRIEGMKFSITKRNGHVETFTIDLTCTIGVSQADFAEQSSINETKSFADSALKTGKTHHRNVVCVTPQKNAGLSFEFPYIEDASRKVIGKIGRYDHTDNGFGKDGEGYKDQA